MTTPTTNRLLLQLAVLLAATVPVMAGAWLALDPHAGELDNHVRYLSGLLLAIGIAFWTTLPRIETKRQRFGLLTALVVTGGLCRLIGVALGDPLSMPTVAALAMELVVTPLLWAWQRSLDQILRHSGHVTASTSSPIAPVIAVASEAPIRSASQPSQTKPMGPVPMQTESTPMMRERMSTGAAR
jgi:hypothetical protein